MYNEVLSMKNISIWVVLPKQKRNLFSLNIIIEMLLTSLSIFTTGSIIVLTVAINVDRDGRDPSSRI
jgi:hypothetical protein